MSNSYIFMDNTNSHVLHCTTEAINLKTVSISVKYTCSAFPRTACSYSIMQYAFLIIEIMFLSSKKLYSFIWKWKKRKSVWKAQISCKNPKQITVRKQLAIIILLALLLLVLFLRKRHICKI